MKAEDFSFIEEGLKNFNVIVDNTFSRISVSLKNGLATNPLCSVMSITTLKNGLTNSFVTFSEKTYLIPMPTKKGPEVRDLLEILKIIGVNDSIAMKYVDFIFEMNIFALMISDSAIGTKELISEILLLCSSINVEEISYN